MLLPILIPGLGVSTEVACDGELSLKERVVWHTTSFRDGESKSFLSRTIDQDIF
ncbi:hypothetical protein glysoja_020801 [Glycine soja]|nr:hypothetical protein glysoja_020801 [Glycine soja]